jgi:tetratricopeptide (TPR) repeat protein
VRTHYVILLLAVAVTYGNSLASGFVWDDHALLLQNAAVLNHDIRAILFSLPNNIEYQPVRDLLFALEYAFFGSTPLVYHTVNALLYFVNAIVIYRFTRELLALLPPRRNASGEGPADATRSLVVAVLFIVHPLHVENVNFIVSRNSLLSGIFLFLSFSFFLRSLRAGNRSFPVLLLASLAAFALSLFSKVSSLVLPAMLVTSGMLWGPAKRWRRTLLSVFPFFVLAAGAFVLFYSIGKATAVASFSQAGEFGSLALQNRVPAAVQLPFFYLGKLLLPVNLSVEYSPAFSGELFSARTLFASFSIALMLFIGIRNVRNSPYLFFCILWFLVMLVPFLNFTTPDVFVADRYAYIPSYALFLLLAMTVPFGKRPARYALVSLVVLWAVLSVVRNGDWRSDRTLWESAVQASPGSSKAHRNLGEVYFMDGEYEKAFAAFMKVDSLDPGKMQERYHRALLHFESGEHGKAVSVLKDVETTDPSTEVLMLLGRSLEMLKDTDGAVSYYLRVAEVSERDPLRLKDRAKRKVGILQKAKREELEEMESRLRGDPNSGDAMLEVALEYQKYGMYREALQRYLRLEGESGEHWALYYNTATVYRKTGEVEKAVDYYYRSLALNPSYPHTCNNLGLSLQALGRHAEAIGVYEKCIQSNRDFAFAPFNLARLYFALGDEEKAREYFLSTKERFPRLRQRVEPYLRELELR